MLQFPSKWDKCRSIVGTVQIDSIFKVCPLLSRTFNILQSSLGKSQASIKKNVKPKKYDHNKILPIVSFEIQFLKLMGIFKISALLRE